MIPPRRADLTCFAVGLVPRLALILAAFPETHRVWFEPFLLAAAGHWADPWTAFLAGGGDPASFPYGSVYLVAFGPATWLGGWLGGAYGAHVGLGLSVLAWDWALAVLIGLVGGKIGGRPALWAYWLSPIPIYVGYWHGQLDAFPTVLLVAGLWGLSERRWRVSGLTLGAAVAAKVSMIIVAPLVAFYLMARPRLRASASWVCSAAVLAVSLLLAPFALSPGFRDMVLTTPEMQKIFAVALQVGPNLNVYLLPFAYLALLYWAWRVRRMSFDMLWGFAGLAFMSLFLLTPASPGWVMWAMPFVAVHVARSGVTGRAAYWTFAAGFVLLQLLVSSGPLLLGGLDFRDPLAGLLPIASMKAPSILMTIMLAGGAALTLQMSRWSVVNSPFRRASRRPFAVGVAGDSGSGKDTLVDAMSDLFGGDAVSRISGDDYHAWDRRKPMWRALTHLNPKANDLETFARDVMDLTDGRTVYVRHYDHGSGRAGEPMRIPAREMVIVSGLHALWSPALNGRYDVRIFMDMDEELRRFLKLQRDVNVRGYAPQKVIESMNRRSADSRRFIRPQARNADVILRLEPRHPSAISDTGRQLDTSLLRLVVILGRGRNFDEPARLLTALCGMEVIETPLSDGRTEVMIEGEPTAADIAAVARRLAPDMVEFLAVAPKWRAGLSGVMQLVILNEIDRSRQTRAVAA